MIPNILISEQQNLEGYTNPVFSTDAFWKQEIMSSPISSSTMNNYDSEERLFFPPPVTLEEESPSGLFILVGDSLYKAR